MSFWSEAKRSDRISSTVVFRFDEISVESAIKEEWRYETIKDQLINENIRFPQVRLVGEAGEQLGIMSGSEANRVAEEKNLDLVVISPNAEPPVCKIMDYGKFKFEQNKRLREQRKAQKIVELKEVQLSMTIELHDMQTKARHANKFLQEGDKVKVTIRMRGRQQARPSMGIDVMREFFELIKENGAIEKEPEILGRNITMIVIPTKK